MSNQPTPSSPSDPESARSPSDSGPIMATLADSSDSQAGAVEAPRPAPRRWVVLPTVLFLLTCVSTFLVGAMSWFPPYFLERWLADQSAMSFRQAILANWREGLLYMGCVLAILLTHEMGHFLVTVRYRIAASYPYFIPLPISPIGTLGAVIRMDGLRADRKEIFDIGLAGPLAGLVVALPITWLGIAQLDTSLPAHGPYAIHPPLILQAMLYLQSAGSYEWGAPIAQGQLNPLLMAGWVGFLITGLNMLPVSQLDGGHVIYTLFLRKGHWIARGFVAVAILYMILVGSANQGGFWLMIGLVLFIGVDHPPTRDDTVKLGWFRTAIGYLSLTIPLLCFSPQLISVY